jgi:hypothetical protein
MPIRRNRYFGWMSARGYEIDVYQTDYVDFCHPGTPVRIRSCFTYALETIKSIESAPLTTDVKVRIIAGMYARLSSLLSKLRDGYETLRKASATRGFELPAWSGNVGRVSPASTMPVFDILARKLETITPGTLVFAHLAMPHYPYAYDRECNIRPDPNTWLNGADLPAFPSRNNAESRAIRYPAYLEQVLCTHRKLDELFTRMKTAGTYEGSVIIVQGDHGSRITLAPPAERNEDRMTTTDYVDAFSTLYAIHRVSGSGRSDDRMIPIDLLLGRFVKRGDAPVGSEPLEPQPVYLHGRKGTKLPRAMPNF